MVEIISSSKHEHYYSQNTEFSCGPSCLIMVVNAFGKEEIIDAFVNLEDLIWEKANTRYMTGSGKAGCSAQGLGLFACKLDLEVKVIDYFSSLLFSEGLNSEHVYEMCQKIKKDEEDFIKTGEEFINSPVTKNLLFDCLKLGGKALVLVDEFEEGGLHWVLADRLVNYDRDVVVLDPWSHHRKDRKNGQIISLNILERIAQHGEHKCGSAVLLFNK